MLHDNDKIYTMKELWDKRTEMGFLPHYLPEIQTTGGVDFMNVKDHYYSYTGGIQIQYVLMDRDGNIVNADPDYTYIQLRPDYLLMKLSRPISSNRGESIQVDYICFIDRIHIEMIVNTEKKSECRILTESIDRGKIIKEVKEETDKSLTEDAYFINELFRTYLSNERSAETLMDLFFR